MTSNRSTIINHYQNVMEDQYRAFDAERARWNTERAGLLGKVAALEDALSQQSIPPYHQVATQKFYAEPFKTAHPHETSGKQVWQRIGSQSTAKPSRTHSEPSTYAPAAGTRLSTISDNTSPSKRRKDFVESFERSRLAHKPSIVGLDNIDGIILKTTSTTSPSQEGHNSESSSFPKPDSNSNANPSSSTTLREELRQPLQHLTLHPVEETQETNLTRDAGHTPLPPTNYTLHGTADDDSPINSASASPSQAAAEQENPPLEPQTTIVRRRPLERSDSYFPRTSPPEEESSNEDPELQQPLSLQHSVFDDKLFLTQVDNKLLQAKQSAALKTSQKNITSRRRSGGGGGDDHGGSNGEDDENEPPEHPEPDPPIVFKKSLNFGSQLGRLGNGRSRGRTMDE
ncbi:MAG: hypothetical protein Q9203_006499 [Teloschistes exilis]